MKAGKVSRTRPRPGREPLAADPVRRGRRVVLRLGVALAVPLALVAAAELSLRLFGFGYPTGFFLEGTQQGRRIITENPHFGRRFFPAHLARTPQPLILTETKPADTCRVFLFGESAAMGDPDPDFGPARMLQTILRGRFPGKQIEVVNVAMTAINSHVVREIARECASRQGDVWVIYMGNNEVIGPFGAGTVFGPQAPPMTIIRLTLALTRTRAGQLLQKITQGIRQEDAAPRRWGGLTMFLEHRVRSDNPRLNRLRQHYAKNLEDVIRYGTRSGAKVVISTVASNLRGCAPFGSAHQPRLSSAQIASWEACYEQGVRFEEDQRLEDAARSYAQAAAIDDSFAALQFRSGRTWLAIGKQAEARQSFQRARDEDTLRFRSDTSNNAIVRTLAAGREAQGVYLVDLEQELARQSPDGISGLNFFWDHVHFNFSGTYAMADAVARQVAELVPEPIQQARPSGSWLSETDCRARLAYSPWNEQKILAEILRRHQAPPCTLQLDHEKRLELWRNQLAANRNVGGRIALLAAVERIRATVPDSEFDWVVHKNVAQMLEAAEELPSAMDEWQLVVQSMPQYANARYHLGNLLDLMGRNREAEEHFREALALEPNMAEALSGLGLALAAQGRFPEAFGSYEQAVALNPESIHAYINWGLGLASQGRFAEAIGKYERALKIDPHSATTYNNLGLSLQALGRTDQALRCYSRALELNPESLSARLNLGRELLRLRQSDQVLALLEPVRLKAPKAIELRNLIGSAYEQLGQHQKAVDEFEEALRLDPHNAEVKQALLRLKEGRRP